MPHDAGVLRARTRVSASLGALLACAAMGAVSCTQHTTTKFPTAAAHPDEDRKPDGIAVDLTSDPPEAQLAAHTDDEVVTLEAPMGIEAAFATVAKFFSAVEREDTSALSRTLDGSVLLHDLRGTGNNQVHSLTSLWRQRFSKHDFHALASRIIYREGDIVSYRGEQLDNLPVSIRYLNPPPPTHPNDIVLRVPIVGHSVKNQRVFGKDLFFWLRRAGDRFAIYAAAEDVPI